MTTTTEYVHVTIPDNAERRYWLNPETWEPGIPIYNPTSDDYGHSRSSRIIVIKRSIPHEEDCTGTDCDRMGIEAFYWHPEPNVARRRFMKDEHGATPAGPGDEFYGATIGERKP